MAAYDDQLTNGGVNYVGLAESIKGKIASARGDIEAINSKLNEYKEYVPVDSSGGRDALGSHTVAQIESIMSQLNKATRNYQTIGARLVADAKAKEAAIAARNAANKKSTQEKTAPTTEPAKKYASTN